jgi:hypothetical protein
MPRIRYNDVIAGGFLMSGNGIAPRDSLIRWSRRAIHFGNENCPPLTSRSRSFLRTSGFRGSSQLASMRLTDGLPFDSSRLPVSSAGSQILPLMPCVEFDENIKISRQVYSCEIVILRDDLNWTRRRSESQKPSHQLRQDMPDGPKHRRRS